MAATHCAKDLCMISHYRDLLTALAESAGLDAASLLASEEVIVNDLTISMQMAGEGEQSEILLCSLLGTATADRWPEVARSLLLANHLWAGTGGATLGLLDEDNTVSLSMRQPLPGLDAQKLSAWVSEMADIGRAWQDFVQQAHSASSTPAWPEATAGLHV